jgi:hypothetical protein
VEAQFLEDGHQAREGQTVDAGRGEVEVEGHIAPEGDEFAAEGQGGGGFADLLAALALDLRGVGEEVVERAVLGDEFGGGLGTDAGNARDVVNRVAHECEHVDDLIGGEAGVGHEGVGGEELVLVDVEDLDASGLEELLEVFVVADEADEHVRVVALEAIDDGGGDIVGLEAFDADDGQPDGLERVEAALNLAREVFGRRRAGGLVVGVEGAAKGAAVARDVEGEGDVGGGRAHGGCAAEEFEEDTDEPEGEVGGFLGDRGGHRRADGVVGPKELGVAIDDVERGAHVDRVAMSDER